MGKNNQTDKTKVVLTIHSDDKQELSLFTQTLNSFGDIFYGTIKEFDGKGNNTTVYIQEIKKGSFVIDFLCAVQPIIPTLLANSGEILFNKINDLWEKLLNKKQPETTHELIMMKDTANMVEVLTNNASDTMTINININGNDNLINFNHEGAKKAVKFAKTLKIEEERILLNKVTMIWEQKNFTNKKTGNKAKIAKISENPINVSFVNKNIEKKMTAIHPNFPDVEWQDLCYVVDVEYVTLGGKPKFCTILKNYSELTTINE